MNYPLRHLAIVGRPKVGKSTLFNRLVGWRRAIVGDEPGITRDRLYGETEWHRPQSKGGRTGGIIPEDKGVYSHRNLPPGARCIGRGRRCCDGCRWPERTGRARHRPGAPAHAHRQAAVAGGQQDRHAADGALRGGISAGLESGRASGFRGKWQWSGGTDGACTGRDTATKARPCRKRPRPSRSPQKKKPHRRARPRSPSSGGRMLASRPC